MSFTDTVQTAPVPVILKPRIWKAMDHTNRWFMLHNGFITWYGTWIDALRALSDNDHNDHMAMPGYYLLRWTKYQMGSDESTAGWGLVWRCHHCVATRGNEFRWRGTPLPSKHTEYHHKNGVPNVH